MKATIKNDKIKFEQQGDDPDVLLNICITLIMHWQMRFKGESIVSGSRVLDMDFEIIPITQSTFQKIISRHLYMPFHLCGLTGPIGSCRKMIFPGMFSNRL
jgi:hypothetical protein